MTALDVRSRMVVAFLASAALGVGALAPGCATGTRAVEEDTGPAMDARGSDARIDAPLADAPLADGARPDAATDAPMDDAAGTACGTVVCTGVTHCVAGRCEDYPACRGDGTCPTAGDVCVARRCVPGDVDVDGDGSPASLDCDETDPARSPLATEICNAIDDDCDTMVDDGDPAALCATSTAGGVCTAGTCGCPAGTVDIDRTVAGCECTAAPALAMGGTCAGAIELGSLSDAATGQSMVAMGNALPMGREVWYHFTAVDAATDPASAACPGCVCDNFRVRVHFTVNPDTAYDFFVRQGTCGATTSCGGFGEGFQDYVLATNFRADISGVASGECPCTPPGVAGVDNISVCADNGGDYYVRVRRAPTSTLSCSSYTLEVSNGV